MSKDPSTRMARAFQLAEIADRAARVAGDGGDAAAQARFEEATRQLVEELTALSTHGVASEIQEFLSATYGGRP